MVLAEDVAASRESVFVEVAGLLVVAEGVQVGGGYGHSAGWRDGRRRAPGGGGSACRGGVGGPGVLA